jgi:hypothetical protein
MHFKQAKYLSIIQSQRLYATFIFLNALRLRMRRTAVFIVTLILFASSLIVIGPVNSVTKPSVPVFTVQLTDRSYNEPPAYQTDPYTGETKLIWAGGYVDNKTLDFTIKNQPFTRYKDANGNDVELYYKIQHKGHFEDWSDSPSFNIDIVRPSSSEDTFASFIISKFSGWDISPNGTVDIRVKAITGYYSVDNSYPWPGRSFLNTVSESDWSATKEIHMNYGAIIIPPGASPTSTTLPSQEPTATTDQSGSQSVTQLNPDWMQIAVVALLVAIAVLLALVVVFLHRRSVNKAQV